MLASIKAKFRDNPKIYYALSICATWAGIGSLMNGVTMTQTYGIIPSLIWVFGNTIACILFGLVALKIPKVREVFGSKIMKKHSKSDKGFGIRAIASSLVGKYVDGAIFTFIGLSFLPLETKIIMVLNCPFVQVCIETALLPVTTFVMKKVKKAEEKHIAIAAQSTSET